MADITLNPIKTFISGETVDPTKLNQLAQSTVALTAGTIVNADVSASAAIALSKLGTGALPTAITVASANLVNGTIVDADVSATAAVALSKLGTGALPAAITVATANIVDANVTPAKLSQPYTLDTAKAGTGTIIDFTGIPSWAKRITVMFSGVSTMGSSLVQVRLGAVGAASVTSSGYTAYGSTNGANATSTTGFITTYTMAAANRIDGSMQICLLSGSTYAASSVFAYNGGNATMAAGSVTLSAVLDRLIVTTVNGTDTFDAGNINISYEG